MPMLLNVHHLVITSSHGCSSVKLPQVFQRFTKSLDATVVYRTTTYEEGREWKNIKKYGRMKSENRIVLSDPNKSHAYRGLASKWQTRRLLINEMVKESTPIRVQWLGGSLYAFQKSIAWRPSPFFNTVIRLYSSPRNDALIQRISWFFFRQGRKTNGEFSELFREHHRKFHGKWSSALYEKYCIWIGLSLDSVKWYGMD